MVITDDDVKTRGQKELLDQITTSNNADANGEDGDGDAASKPKIAREGTMAVTAKVLIYAIYSCIIGVVFKASS